MHLSETAITGTNDSGCGLELARVENHRQVVTADQVKTWCANPDTQVTVKPVIDLAEHIATAAYEIPDRLIEQTDLRDHTCVFPWCTRRPDAATTTTSSPTTPTTPRPGRPAAATSPHSADDITA